MKADVETDGVSVRVLILFFWWLCCTGAMWATLGVVAILEIVGIV